MKSGAENIQDIEAFINTGVELAKARENGIDLWALWHNLQRTPAERLRRHQNALETRRKLQKAKTL